MALINIQADFAGPPLPVSVVTRGPAQGRAVRAVDRSRARRGGRNHYGRITTRHQGGGHKQHYRMIDFKRDKDGIPAQVERIEYDPNRTAHIALLCTSMASVATSSRPRAWRRATQ